MGKIFDILDESIVKDPPIQGDYVVNLYPSEASAKVDDTVFGKCARAVYLRYKKALGQQIEDSDGNLIPIIEDKPDARSEWIFEAGSQFERMLIERARLANIFVCGHTKFSIDLPHNIKLKGELDAVFQDRDGKFVGIEIKSIHGAKAESAVIGSPAMRKRGFKGKPKDEHLMQTAVYAWHFRKQIEAFHILYIMRDKCQRTEFEVKVKEDPYGQRLIFVDGREWESFTFNDIMVRYEQLAEYLYTNTLPPRDFDLVYDDEKMCLLSEKKLLSKADKEAWDKYWSRILEQKAGKKTRLVQRPIVGSWVCSYFNFSKNCYTRNGLPLEKLHDPSSVALSDMAELPPDSLLPADLASETDNLEDS